MKAIIDTLKTLYKPVTPLETFVSMYWYVMHLGILVLIFTVIYKSYYP